MTMRPIRRDARYTITLEFCGHEVPHYVARFDGDWLGSSAFRSSAVMLAIGEHARRNGALIVTAERAPGAVEK